MLPAEELAEASLQFQLALAKLGVATIAEAIKLWRRMAPTQRETVASNWLDEAVLMVMTRRGESRAIARAYYRLSRALMTGTTVADPYHPEPDYISLNDLRDEFAMLTLGEAPIRESQPLETADPTQGTPDASEALIFPTADPVGGTQPAAPSGSSDADDSDSILVEEIAELAREEERIERLAEEELRLALEALGPENLASKLRDIDTSEPADDVDRQRQEANDRVGNRQAAAAERLVLNGARSTSWNHMTLDRRAIGYVRVSRTGTPCGWCAMLISRGPVYKSDKSAEFKSTFGEGDLYHDNCHCYSVAVYSDAQYDSPEFDLNRKYASEWPKVTRGLSGKAAVSAWRRFIRQEQKAASKG